MNRDAQRWSRWPLALNLQRGPFAQKLRIVFILAQFVPFVRADDGSVIAFGSRLALGTDDDAVAAMDLVDQLRCVGVNLIPLVDDDARSRLGQIIEDRRVPSVVEDVAQRDDRDLIDGCDRPLGCGIERAERLDRVTDELEPDGASERPRETRRQSLRGPRTRRADRRDLPS